MTRDTRIYGHLCSRNDSEIQRKLSRGIWYPSMDTGHIYSTEIHRNLREDTNRNGYLTVGTHRIKVSRIIWIAAHGIPQFGLEVDHINGVKTDNRLENLQLISHAENCRKSSCLLTFREAEEIRRARQNNVPRKLLAEHYRVSLRTIDRIIAGETYREEFPDHVKTPDLRYQIAALDTETIAEICAAYESGESCARIARDHTLSIPTVRSVVRKYRLTQPNVPENRTAPNPQSEPSCPAGRNRTQSKNGRDTA